MSSILNILYLEARKDIREINLRYFCKVLGHRIYNTATTEEAKWLLSTRPIDIVILTHSVNDPKADVRKLAQAIMEENKLPLIVICNGSSELFPDAPIVVEKPMLPKDIKAAIDTAMATMAK